MQCVLKFYSNQQLIVSLQQESYKLHAPPPKKKASDTNPSKPQNDNAEMNTSDIKPLLEQIKGHVEAQEKKVEEIRNKLNAFETVVMGIEAMKEDIGELKKKCIVTETLKSLLLSIQSGSTTGDTGKLEMLTLAIAKLAEYQTETGDNIIQHQKDIAVVKEVLTQQSQQMAEILQNTNVPGCNHKSDDGTKKSDKETMTPTEIVHSYEWTDFQIPKGEIHAESERFLLDGEITNCMQLTISIALLNIVCNCAFYHL